MATHTGSIATKRLKKLLALGGLTVESGPETLQEVLFASHPGRAKTGLVTTLMSPGIGKEEKDD